MGRGRLDDKTERCQNPFFPCTSPNPTLIALDIIYKGERLNICQDCWNKIADTDIEWTNSRQHTN